MEALGEEVPVVVAVPTRATATQRIDINAGDFWYVQNTQRSLLISIYGTKKPPHLSHDFQQRPVSSCTKFHSAGSCYSQPTEPNPSTSSGGSTRSIVIVNRRLYQRQGKYEYFNRFLFDASPTSSPSVSSLSLRVVCV